MTIQQNYHQLLQNVDQAAQTVGKTKEDITIVVASKYAKNDQLKEVIDAGATIIGENRAQDLTEHQSSISNSHVDTSQLQWHFIGHLQTNKINKILGSIDMLHSLDSFELAEALDTRIAMRPWDSEPMKLPVLIEINIANDPDKFGIKPEELETFLSQLDPLTHLSPQGLMTVGKIWENAQEARIHFAHMRTLLYQFIRNSQLDSSQFKPQLSMGMSRDYTWAIEEGATMIRVGSALFNKD